MALLRKPALLRSSKLAKRKRRTLYIKTALVIFVGAAFIGTSAYFLSQPQVLIRTVEVRGTEALVASDIQALVEEELAGRYFFLFPRSSVFLYPRRSIEATVHGAYQRIKDIDVSRNSLQSVIVTVKERRPEATWCSRAQLVSVEHADDMASSTEEVPTGTTRGADVCYFLDESGFIFDEAPRFTGDVYFRFYGPIEGDEPVGAQYLSRDEFAELAFFLQTLEGIDIEGVSLESESTDYTLHMREGSDIRFSRDQNLTDAFRNLESVLTSDVFKEKNLAEVEYIDLRFGNKVYYKFR